MQGKETTLQSLCGLCGKRRRDEEKGVGELPSKFPKLNNESNLTSVNNNEEIESLSNEWYNFFAEASPFPTNEYIDCLFQEDEVLSTCDSNNELNFGCNNEVIVVNDDSDIVQEDTLDENDVEENCTCETTDNTANFTSNLNLSSNSEMNRDESEGQRNSDAPEMMDNIDDSNIIAEIDCKTREKNHGEFILTDELKEHDLASFAFVQEKIGKQREFQISVLEKSCTGVTPSLRGPTGYFNVKYDGPYSQDKRKTLYFNRNNFGRNIQLYYKKFKYIVCYLFTLYCKLLYQLMMMEL